jgi:hypothetical protein
MCTYFVPAVMPPGLAIAKQGCRDYDTGSECRLRSRFPDYPLENLGQVSSRRKTSGCDHRREATFAQCEGTRTSGQLFAEQIRRITDGQTDFCRRLRTGARSFRPASRFERVRGLFLSHASYAVAAWLNSRPCCHPCVGQVLEVGSQYPRTATPKKSCRLLLRRSERGSHSAVLTPGSSHGTVRASGWLPCMHENMCA